MSGCLATGALIPRVNLWDRPPGPESAALVDRLRGTGVDGLCRGTVVVVREVRRVTGRKVARVVTVRGGREGWILEAFVGRRFPRRECRDRFVDPPALDRCLGRETETTRP